jgi:hypothetical protein
MTTFSETIFAPPLPIPYFLPVGLPCLEDRGIRDSDRDGFFAGFLFSFTGLDFDAVFSHFV